MKSIKIKLVDARTGHRYERVDYVTHHTVVDDQLVITTSWRGRQTEFHYPLVNILRWSVEQ